MLRVVFAVSTAVVLNYIGFATFASPTAYAATCTSSYGSQFSGYLAPDALDASGNTFEGIDGVIEDNAGSNCDDYGAVPDQDNFVTDWVMLANANATVDNRAHIQVGYFHYYGSCTYYFTEWQKYDGGDFTRSIDTADGCRNETSAEFRVKWNSSTSHEDMLVDSELLASSPFDPYNVWGEPFIPEVSAESKYIQSNIPGTSSDPTLASDVVLQKFNNSWQSTSDGYPARVCISPQPQRYVRGTWSNHQFNFYTDVSSSGGNNVC